MTLANDFISDIDSVDLTSGAASAAKFALQVTRLVVGVGLTFTAALMWLLPGASWSTDLILMKVVLSITAFAAGVIVLSLGRTQDTTEIEIDAAENAVRVIAITPAGQRSVQSSTPFQDLYHVEHEGGALRFWKDENTVLAEVSNVHSQVIANLSHALRRAGKLA